MNPAQLYSIPIRHIKGEVILASIHHINGKVQWSCVETSGIISSKINTLPQGKIQRMFQHFVSKICFDAFLCSLLILLCCFANLLRYFDNLLCYFDNYFVTLIITFLFNPYNNHDLGALLYSLYFMEFSLVHY